MSPSVKPEISPRGSMRGYRFLKYVEKNADVLKALGTATIGLTTAAVGAFGTQLPLEIVPAISLFASAAFHAGVSALQFKYSEVELK